MDSRSKDEMKKEAFVMKELSHPCIVRLYGVSQSRKMNSILMVLRNCLKKYLIFFYCMAQLNASNFLFRITANANITRRFGYWFKQTNILYTNK
jgi:serine/threonine protein kinase